MVYGIPTEDFTQCLGLSVRSLHCIPTVTTLLTALTVTDGFSKLRLMWLVVRLCKAANGYCLGLFGCKVIIDE